MRIRRAVLDAIVAHARRASPEECCGLLIGSDSEIIEAIATANMADEPRRHYEIDPADFMAQIWRCRTVTAAADSSSLTVVGAYHSHPHSQPDPSPTDVERAFTNFLFLIAGPAEGTDPCMVRAYELIDGNLQPVELVPHAEEADRR